jgi:hypothetical protein
MKRTNVILMAAVIALSVAGCGKKKEVTKKDRLVERDWVLVSHVSNDGVKDTDEFALLTPCEKDNIDHYDIDGVFHYDEGATKCNTTDPQEAKGNWAFDSDQTTLTVTDGLFAIVFTEVEFTDGKLKLTRVLGPDKDIYTYESR